MIILVPLKCDKILILEIWNAFCDGVVWWEWAKPSMHASLAYLVLLAIHICQQRTASARKTQVHWAAGLLLFKCGHYSSFTFLYHKLFQSCTSLEARLAGVIKLSILLFVMHEDPIKKSFQTQCSLWLYLLAKNRIHTYTKQNVEIQGSFLCQTDMSDSPHLESRLVSVWVIICLRIGSLRWNDMVPIEGREKGIILTIKSARFNKSKSVMRCNHLVVVLQPSNETRGKMVILGSHA